jgi:hypothetical protein
MSRDESTAAIKRRRWWFVQQLVGSAFIAYIGWTHTFGGAEWLHKELLICAGLGLGIVFVELERGR